MTTKSNENKEFISSLSYFNYQELSETLKRWVEIYPDYLKLESLGTSVENREFWLLTLSKNIQTHANKPALWLDGNIHATELSGTQMCLYTIEYLLENKDKEDVDFLLTHFTLYIFPRVSVDGAEFVLKTKAMVRSSNVLFHENEKIKFECKDLDQNQLILQMRIQDPAGHFKVSKKDSRLMIAREATDVLSTDGPFYHLLPEGEFVNANGENLNSSTVKNLDLVQKPLVNSFDLNRQSPAFFNPEQAGAGEVPLFLKEAQVITQAFTSRKNICTAISFHTFGAVFLHPPSTYSFTELAELDQTIYNKIGQIAFEKTTYPVVNSYTGFRYSKNSVTRGLWCDWYYEHRGALAWTPELWSLMKELKIEIENPVQNFENLGEENYLKALSWCDQNLQTNEYYQDWQKMDHPQLGTIEIGGWIPLMVWSNPPKTLLPALLNNIYQFVEINLKLLPLLKASNVSLKKISENNYLLKFKIQNEGYLPSYINQKAKNLKLHPEPYLQIKTKIDEIIFEKKCKHLSGRVNYEPSYSPLFSHLQSRSPDSNQEFFEIFLENINSKHLEIECTIDYQMAGKVHFTAKAL